jgi:DASH complex subunit DAD1
MSQSEDMSFFDRERDRLSNEITAGFEELLSTSNVLNRKLEEVLGMTREYETISSLWNSFHELMRRQQSGDPSEDKSPGLPGTGGHTISSK